MSQMCSDNGSNFIRARRELNEVLAEMEQRQVKQDMLKENCDWFELKLNVPSASHMGLGMPNKNREKCALRPTGEKRSSNERTFMCEAEAAVNS